MPVISSVALGWSRLRTLVRRWGTKILPQLLGNVTAWFLPHMKALLASGSFKAEFSRHPTSYLPRTQVGSFYGPSTGRGSVFRGLGTGKGVVLMYYSHSHTGRGF
jgi:hypothetical protein